MLADLSDRAKFLVSGPDARRYLNGQVTNDVSRLRNGTSCWALVCTHKGKIEADVVIGAIDDGFLIDAHPSLREPLLARLGRYLVADDCEVSDVTDKWALFHELPDPIPPMNGATERRSDADVRASHIFTSSRYAVAGRDLWLPAEAPRPVAEASLEWLELFRIEHGVPAWGSELTPDVLPQEARLEARAIDFNKGCYVGQEVISRIKSVGHVNRLLVPLIAVEGGDWLRAGHRLFAGDPMAPVGTVTSARFHPALQKSIALGFLKRTFAAIGSRFRAGPFESELAGSVEIRALDT
jgi:folate-binding protein YgfZ